MSPSITFDARLKRIGRKHDRIRRNGYVGRLDKNGLLTMQPRRKGPALPARGFAIVLLTALAFKAVLLAVLGPAQYDERLATLASGSPVERAGAFVMLPDPATRLVADLVAPLL
ncbi:hypothetical protein [Wenxinia saemankumensis]|uniref:Uncharacterized protein n=1 Tax=Wenxinia saemankumensis TaxID=1447782 RepID=A0A1M6BZ30_9RHOB|nr:hypothetical protein [Wenxinia saemankumensis]SHI53913.1 hypothetical protein SAMN05444417_0918 [Wenxinia saemankumensis]